MLKFKIEKVKNQVEEYEYEDFSHDYRLGLLQNRDKFLQLFGGDRELIKLRETNERDEKLNALTLSFFGTVIGGILVYLLVDLISNIDRKMERIVPAYKL